ncbi:MAG: carboxypeptidase-like regulatory domain-containing protein [Bacteroidales bacterium]|nr:carboxypeptidase-like regulatory domain-containing protein [Bacteroidales bacterium]
MKKIIKKSASFILLILLTISHLNGQNGSISGHVSDKNNGERLIGATVILEGTVTGVSTDIEGRFAFTNLKPGKYALKFSYVSYKPVIIENVIVEPGMVRQIDVELEEELVSLGDITVSAVRRTNTEISVITDIKASAFVSTGISGQQISKTLDKDASEVVKRVPGITIMDNRFLIVRGLSQRYNNVWLNNAATPSAEADVRAFSFDIVPSSMIENIMIFKSPSSELPADFSGGFVKISTKNMPEKNGFFFTYSTGINDNSTFQKFYKQVPGKTDWLGFDNGSRALPEDMPLHLNQYESATNPVIREKITSLGRVLNNEWKPITSVAYPDQKFLLGLNKKIQMGRSTFGNTSTITYSLSNNADRILINDYSIYNFSNDKPSFLNQFIDNQYSNSARVALMNNSTLFLGERNKIEFRNLFNQTGISRYTTREGREWYNNGRYIHSDELRYMSRSIYTGQLAGDHSSKNDKSRFEWILGYAFSNKKEPDTKRYRYIRDQVDTTKYILLFSDQADLSSQSRMWIDLNENTISASVNYTRKIDLSGFKAEIRTGFYYENKDRKFNARNFGYAKGSLESVFGQTTLPVEDIFIPENINLSDGIKLMEVTSLSDSYTASNNQVAGYLSARFPLGNRFNIYSGLRIEKNRQTLSSYKQGSTIKVDVDRDTINLFPSANITFKLNEESLFRFAYGMTVNRPEFREIAPFYYVDFELNAGIYGAPHIRQSYIHSFDLRYELYPGTGEIFNLGAFYKKFENPIEQVILGNSPTQYSFENVKSAYSAGLEAEVRKSLDFISGFQDFMLVINGSLITSRVQFEEGKLARNRPLEGQSPFIVNAGLFYQNEKRGLMLSALYNVIGKRIVAVGRPSPNEWEDIPDIYELPRNIIDLTISKTIGKKIEVKGGIKDLLNEQITYQQTVNATVNMSNYNGGGDGLKQFNRSQNTKAFYPGRYFSLGVSIKM